jgi:hypothetical protein
MTAPVTQPPPRPQTPPQQGNGFQQKLGPLPVWAWIALAAAGGVVLLLWTQSRKSNSSDTATSPVDTATLGDNTGALETLASQIRDLQGANSQPTTPGIPRDHGIYYFGIEGDADPARRYIGIPGVGYYWVPDIGTATQFLNSHPQTISLGQISEGDVATRFGFLLPWARFGMGPTQPTQYSPTNNTPPPSFVDIASGGGNMKPL